MPEKPDGTFVRGVILDKNEEKKLIEVFTRGDDLFTDSNGLIWRNPAAIERETTKAFFDGLDEAIEDFKKDQKRNKKRKQRRVS